MLRLVALFITSAVLVLASCSDDGGPVGDGAVQEGGGGVKDALPWPDLPVKLDSTAWTCTASSTACSSSAPKTMYCNAGVCAACPAYYYNCDTTGDCECAGACDGAKCVGTSTACKFDDKDVCGGNTAQYCGSNNKCVACPSGTQNCDKTKDCECTTGCNGKKCK